MNNFNQNTQMKKIIFPILVTLFIGFSSCSKTDPIPGVSNPLSFTYNGTAYSSPATFTQTSQSLTGFSYTQVAVTSVNNPVLSITFGFTNSSLGALVGIPNGAVNTFALGGTYQILKVNTTSATSGSLTVTSYDGSTLSGTFSAVGSNFTITGGTLSGVKKL